VIKLTAWQLQQIFWLQLPGSPVKLLGCIAQYSILFFTYCNMQLLIHSSRLNAPALASLEEYANRRFQQLLRILPRFGDSSLIRVGAKMERHEFVITVEINVHKPIYIEVRHPNLYAAVDKAHDLVKKVVREQKERRLQRRFRE
jgi:ribosome-associated translation inhibitor RaiA